MSNSQNSEVEALKRLLDTNLNLGSPIRTPLDKGPEPPTIKKTIRIKLKQTSPAKSPAKSPIAKSVDVSFETPVFDFSQVLVELERTEEAGSAQQKEESGVSVSTLLNISADEPISAHVLTESAPILTESAPIPAFPFPLPNYAKWLVAIEFAILVSWITFPFNVHFIKVADIKLDEELRKKSTKTKPEGGKARQTFICFFPTIPPKEFAEEAEWIYIFLVDGKIVKIGGTRTGLLKRCGSYLSGHGIPELKGNSTSTNAYIYWTFLDLLLQGKKVEMYAYRLPNAIVTQTAFGITKTIRTQCFHDWEAYCMEEFAKLYGRFPPLSDNCDPRYREKGKGKGKEKTASKK